MKMLSQTRFGASVDKESLRGTIALLMREELEKLKDEVRKCNKVTKVEFPRFGGDDVNGWLFKCEQIFRVNGVLDERKVPLLSEHLTGIALEWHKVVTSSYFLGKDVPWMTYRKSILQRFGNVQKTQFSCNSVRNSSFSLSLDDDLEENVVYGGYYQVKDEKHCSAHMMFDELPIEKNPKQEVVTDWNDIESDEVMKSSNANEVIEVTIVLMGTHLMGCDETLKNKNSPTVFHHKDSREVDGKTFIENRFNLDKIQEAQTGAPCLEDYVMGFGKVPDEVGKSSVLEVNESSRVDVNGAVSCKEDGKYHGNEPSETIDKDIVNEILSDVSRAGDEGKEFESKNLCEVIDYYNCCEGCDKFVQESEKSGKHTSFRYDSLGFVKLHEVDEKKLNRDDFKSNKRVELKLGYKGRSISSNRTENDGMGIEKLGVVAKNLSEFENVKEVVVTDKEIEEYDIRKVFDKVGDVIEGKFFSPHASYSEFTILKLDVKMDQERKQKGNSDKETRNPSHLDARSLLMHFKVDEKNGNSFGYWMFDMWKWPKRKKGCYTNYKFKGRWWKFEYGNGLTENIFNNGNSFEFFYGNLANKEWEKNGPCLNGTFVDHVVNELTNMEFKINTFIDIVTGMEAEPCTQVESLWVNDFQDKLTNNGRGTLSLKLFGQKEDVLVGHTYGVGLMNTHQLLMDWNTLISKLEDTLTNGAGVETHEQMLIQVAPKSVVISAALSMCLHTCCIWAFGIRRESLFLGVWLRQDA